MKEINKREFVIPDPYAELLGFESENSEFPDFFRRPTSKNVPYNAKTYGVFYNENYLIFNNEVTFRDWQYYAGLEYLTGQSEKPQILQLHGTFYAVFSEGTSDRIDEILYRLNDNNETED